MQPRRQKRPREDRAAAIAPEGFYDEGANAAVDAKRYHLAEEKGLEELATLGAAVSHKQAKDEARDLESYKEKEHLAAVEQYVAELRLQELREGVAKRAPSSQRPEASHDEPDVAFSLLTAAVLPKEAATRTDVLQAVRGRAVDEHREDEDGVGKDDDGGEDDAFVGVDEWMA
jgi:hypothetical protein